MKPFVYRILLRVLVLIAFFLLAGCGESITGKAPAPTGTLVGIDPCSLITNAQASQVLGAQVTGSPGVALPQCAYQNTAQSSQILVKVGTSQDASGYYQLLKSLSTNPTAISGIGDAAFYSDGINGNLYNYVFGNSITVLMGKAVFNIALTDGALNDAAVRAAAERLAKEAESVVTAILPTLGSPQTDPCVLVTKNDVSQLFGGIQVQTLDGVTPEGAISCTYSTPSSHDSAFTAVETYSNAGDAKSFFDSTKPPGAKDANGIGDAAFFDALGALEVLKGTAIISVTISGTTSTAASEEQLAHDAIGRL